MISKLGGDNKAGVPLHANAHMESSRPISVSPKDNSKGHQRKPTNPFRQYRDVSSAARTRAVSEETESSMSGIRKNAPPRAVFHDLPTAHSSITSGTARARARDTSNHLLDVFNDGDSILLQDLDPITRSTEYLKILPLPPPPAIVSHGRYVDPTADCLLNQGKRNISDHNISGRHSNLATPTLKGIPAQPNSMFTTIKSALVSISPPATVKDTSSMLTPSQWMKGGLKSYGDDNPRVSIYDSIPVDIADAPIISKTPWAATQNPTLRKSRQRHSNDGCNVDLSSIYNSNLGEAPSGTMPSSSGDDISAQRPSHLGAHQAAHYTSFDLYNEAAQSEDFATPDGQERSLALPQQMVKFGHESNDASSLPDGSTVGDIYKHYVRSACEGEQNEFDLPRLDKTIRNNLDHEDLEKHTRKSSARATYQLRPSALVIRKQRRAERLDNIYAQIPKSKLPNVSCLVTPHTLPSTSQELSHSSSYEDTYNLLEITPPSHWAGLKPAFRRSDARKDLLSDNVSPEYGDSSPPSLSTFGSNNPYNGIQGLQVVISQPTEDDVIKDSRCNYSATNRQPLEREVSDALRRISGYTTFSNGSIASSLLRYTDYHSELQSSESVRRLRRRNIEDTPPPDDSGSTSQDSRPAVHQMQAFYNQGAIASAWINNRQNNAVRIPITRKGSFPDSPPRSPLNSNNLELRILDHVYLHGPVDEVNDWETVGETAPEGDYKTCERTRKLLECTVGQAGSSIANTSDDGTASTFVPEFDRYNSTERFVQHPGPIEYHSDYRLRNLKETQTPVFLPKFRDHKINGYLADSNRTRPPVNLFSYNPRPLGASHAHPFQSPPPEHMPVQKTKPSPNPRNYQTLNPTPCSMNIIDDTETGYTEEGLEAATSPVRIFRPSRETHNWMDDFGDPGPAIRITKQKVPSPTSERRPSSYEHVMILANGGTIPGYNPDGTLITNSNPVGHHSYANYDSHQNSQADGFVETPRDHKTLVRGPPGAFFRGVLGSKRNLIRPSGERAAKIFARPKIHRVYPTNALRPISLLGAQQIALQTGPDGHELNGGCTANDFIYRSPLGPPKCLSSRMLYTQSQLDILDELGKADCNHLRASRKDSGFRRQLFENPRLVLSTEDAFSSTDLYQERKKLSNIVLCLCNLFPPLLFLYARGQLDGIAVWWTDGESSKFGKRHKRYAYIMMTCWGVVTFLGLITFLIYWFTALHR